VAPAGDVVTGANGVDAEMHLLLRCHGSTIAARLGSAEAGKLVLRCDVKLLAI
jgi:hypothetical protein